MQDQKFRDRVIAQSVALWDAENSVREHTFNLNEFFDQWKEERGHGWIKKDAEEWEEMMVAADPKLQALKRVKKDHYNAKRRFETAVRRYVSEQPRRLMSLDESTTTRH